MSIEELLNVAYQRGYSDGWREGQADKMKLKVFADTENCAIILNLIQTNYNVTMKEMEGRTRKRSVVLPRQLAMFLLKTYTRITLVEIGRMFGNRDHTTVIHSAETIKDLMSTGDSTAADLIAMHLKAKELINIPKTVTDFQVKEKKVYIPPAPKLKKRIFTAEELGIKVDAPFTHKVEEKQVIERPPAVYSNKTHIK